MTSFSEQLGQFASQNGDTLDALSRTSPVFVVFLRHGGCPFCREALAKVAAQREAIEADGARIALVHMMTDAEGADLFKKYSLDDVPRFSDPDRKLYEAFGLQRGSVNQVVGPAIWWKGLKSALAGHLPGRPRGDVYQLPGSFLLADGQIVKGQTSESSADLPDYVQLTRPASV